MTRMTSLAGVINRDLLRVTMQARYLDQTARNCAGILASPADSIISYIDELLLYFSRCGVLSSQWYSRGNDRTKIDETVWA